MTTLVVTAAGGHLAEMRLLAARLPAAAGPLHWVTSESEQSRALLAGERVTFARLMRPRDVGGVARNLPLARRLLRGGDVDCVVSNGAGIALAFLPMARALGIPCHYIECAARTAAPSLTGRVLERIGGIHLYAQREDWSSSSWTYAGSVLDGYAPVPADDGRDVVRVLVTVGTVYPFRRLIERVLEVVPRGVRVQWQFGSTVVDDLPIVGRAWVPPRDLDRQIADADVVVAHSGIGSALAVLAAGKRPVLVPREQRHDEHVDDHQWQLAAELERRGLAVARSVDELRFADLERARTARVVEVGDPPPLRVSPEGWGRASDGGRGDHGVARDVPVAAVRADAEGSNKDERWQGLQDSRWISTPLRPRRPADRPACPSSSGH